MISLDFKKLIGSKWTAVSPEEKQKHFVVTDVVGSAKTGRAAELQAIRSRRIQRVSAHDLCDIQKWMRGWA